MKRKIDLIEKELESEKEGSGSSDSDSDDEEPRIKDVLSNLSFKLLLTCCIAWPLPEIFWSGLPADNDFEVNV